MKNKMFVHGSVKSLDVEKRQAVFVVSDGQIDRHGDSLNPGGWQLENYSKNPVILFGHDYKSLPIGKALKTWVENGAEVLQLVEFATHKFAEEVWELVKGGFLNATSVGFIPLKFDETGKYTWDEMELLEVSVVPVPANPRALGKKEIAFFKSLEDHPEPVEDEAEEDTEEKPEASETTPEETTETPESSPTVTDTPKADDVQADSESGDKPEDQKELATLSLDEVNALIKDAVAVGISEALASKKDEHLADSTKGENKAAAKVMTDLEQIRDYLKTSDKAVGLALRTIKEMGK